MVGTVKFELKGAAELDKALRTLGPRVATNVWPCPSRSQIGKRTSNIVEAIFKRGKGLSA